MAQAVGAGMTEVHSRQHYCHGYGLILPGEGGASKSIETPPKSGSFNLRAAGIDTVQAGVYLWRASG